MEVFRAPTAAVLALGLATSLPSAPARPALVSSTPAAASGSQQCQDGDADVQRGLPAGKMSGVEIVMTGMPGMEDHHPAMKIGGVKVAAGADGKSLVAMLPLARFLPAATT
jgi:hypothetical protein